MKPTASDPFLPSGLDLEAVFQAAPVGLAVLDRELRFCRVNERMAEMDGLPAAEHLGRRAPDLFPELGERLHPLVEWVLSTGKTVREVEIEGLTGEMGRGERCWLASYHPLIGRGGGIEGVVCAMQDVTDQKRATQALENVDRRKNEFLATLSHELRTPLTPLRNALHLLWRDPALPAAKREQLERVMYRQVLQLSRLVDDLLEISRISQGRLDVRPECVDLSAVAVRAAEAYEPAMAAHKLVFRRELPARPLWVEADASRVEQVIGNLLHNAIKYTEPAGEVVLRLAEQGGEAVLSVKDTGRGFAPEMRHRIFDMFQQEERAGIHSRGGLGIGLTLVQRLVELHGGSVEAASPGPGRGSEFTIRLPASEPAAEGTEPAIPEAEPEEAGMKLKVLVVDDDCDTAETLALLVQHWGHEARTAFDGRGGLEVAAEYRPGVVLLDLNLPDLDGLTVAGELRRMAGDELRLVAVTGWGRQEDRERSQEAGFDRHLLKPLDPAELKRLLDAWCSPGRPT